MNQLHFKFEVFAYSMAVGYFTTAVRLRILCLAFYFVHFVAGAARGTTWHRLLSSNISELTLRRALVLFHNTRTLFKYDDRSNVSNS